MQQSPGGADLGTMAAILFLVAILGLLVAGRTQAQAADGSKPLFSFQLWQLALVLPVVCAAPDVPTIAKVIALVATASAFSFSVFRARHAHDFDDLHF